MLFKFKLNKWDVEKKYIFPNHIEDNFFSKKQFNSYFNNDNDKFKFKEI